MRDINEIHYSVMKEESVDSLKLKPGQTVVDCTVNRAGHAELIAQAIGKDGTLIIFDLDKQALDFSFEKLSKIKNAPKIIKVHSNYRFIKDRLDVLGIKQVDAIFADLGLSSQELEVSGRGFTFQKDEPLYMTFQSEVTEDVMTAKDLINDLNEEDLANIIWAYGDEPKAKRIAKAIVDARDIKPIETTKELSEIIETVVKKSGKTNPSTKTFQALRIAVNDEYNGIKDLIEGGYSVLKEGGIFSIITFHSGEDRIVKTEFKNFAKSGGREEKFKPKRSEVLENKRSRSAILRTLIK